jgi:hypothetical protein
MMATNIPLRANVAEQTLYPFEILKGYHRHDVVRLLKRETGNVGIELGVAEGVFAERMMASGRFKRFFGVDDYADIHNTAEYKSALKRIGLERPYALLRMRFDEAFDLFDDQYFDFVYIDGYAHGGEEGGQTIFNWYRKVKIGGVIAGDDYSQEWPLVVWAVNELALQTENELMVTEIVEDGLRYCRYPTWAMIKTREVLEISPPADLIAQGRAENERVLQKRMKKLDAP